MSKPSRLRKGIAEAALLLGLALLAAMVAAALHPKRPVWKDTAISVAEARRAERRVLWIDARPKAEYDAAHIKGALPLNEDEWDELLGPVIDAWTPETQTIVYCGRATCNASREVAQRLREEVGLANIFVLKGGWDAWAAAK